ncbi:hypothetical protein FQA39_LY02033 [Lamprigera yunnana]|nr:hypothetical protein FQA39_LY02033 [Lamprigera yunnana]
MYSIIKTSTKSVQIKRVLPTILRCSNFRNESGIIRSLLPDVEIPNVTIPEFMFEKFNKYPHKVAIECGITGRKYTFEEVLIKSKKLDKVLRKIFKLIPGDIVAILLPNVPEYPICVFGCLQANIVVTTINPNYTPDEISKQLLDTNPKAIITLGTLYSVVTTSLRITNQKIPIISIKSKETEALPIGAINFHELLNEVINIDDIPEAKATDVALLPYSSGTTGLPKGVQLTHRNVVANICQRNHPSIKITLETTETHQDVIPAILPFFHVYGLNIILFTYIRALSKIVTIPKFTPEVFFDILKTHRPHVLLTAPPIVNFITSHPDVQQKYFQSVRLAICGASPLSAKDEGRFISKVGSHVTVKQGYGLTETSPAVLLLSNRAKENGIYGSIGELIPNTEIKLINKDNDYVLKPNEAGELLVKGPQLMKGYYNRPEENKNAFLDGFFKTGDLLYFDENNFFFILGRLKELIKVKGFQVAPAELEDILRTHPDVLDAAVIGVNHPKYGEVPRAYIVPKSNHKIRTDHVLEYIAQQVVDYKRLVGGVAILDSIPKNSAGKIMRNELKQLYETETTK